MVQEGAVSSSGGSGDGTMGDGSANQLARQIGPVLLDAIDAFFFVLNPDGVLEFVSRNVSNYLNLTRVS